MINMTKEDRIGLNRRNIICDSSGLEELLSVPPENEVIIKFLPYFDEYLSLRTREIDRPWFSIMDSILSFFLETWDGNPQRNKENFILIEKLAINFLLAVGEEI